MTRALVFFGHSCVSHFFSTRPLLDDFIHFSQTERVFRQKARENKNFSKKAKKKSPKHPHNFSFSSSSRSSSSQRGYIYTHKGRARRKVVSVFKVKPLFSRREFSRKRERERVELLFFFPFCVFETSERSEKGCRRWFFLLLRRRRLCRRENATVRTSTQSGGGGEEARRVRLRRRLRL